MELTKQNIINVFYRMCRLQFGDNSYVPKLEHTFEYLKFDDLDVKGLVMSCEEVFGVDMGDPLAERPNINNLHGIFNVLMDKLVASGQFVPKRRRRPEEGDEGTGKKDNDDDLALEAEDEISESPADGSEAPDKPDSTDEDDVNDDGKCPEDETDAAENADSADKEMLPDPPAEIDLGQADTRSPDPVDAPDSPEQETNPETP